MKPIARCLTLLFSVIAGVTLGCNSDATTLTFPPPTPGGASDPLAPVGIITVPGNPIVSSTKTWVDGNRLYLTDVSNAGVDIIDATTRTYVSRIPGFIGTGAAAAVSGPNSIVFTGDGKAWVSDGISAVRIVDLATNAITTTISTAIAACDNGTIHNCQRTNEITYDSEHKIIFVQNPSPLDLTGAAIDTYGTFISTLTNTVLGTITFANRRGQEAPVYDAAQHRFLSSVSGRLDATTTPATYYDQFVAVIDPTVIPFVVEKKYTIDCFALGIGASQGATFGINDPSLGPSQGAATTIVVPGCGKAVIMNTTTGAATAVMQVGGGNETWYNSGDGNYYTTGADLTTGINSLGVINATTGVWKQSVPAISITNPAAHAASNTVFAVAQVSAAQVLAPATDNTACASFGVQGKGCVVVFAHVKPSSAVVRTMPRVVPADGGVAVDDDGD